MDRIVHRLLGLLSVVGTPGTVFEPLGWFLDPSRFEAACAVWRSRFRRSSVCAGLPAAARASREEQAVEDCLSVYLDTDYAAAGVLEEQFARAVLRAARWLERANWTLPAAGDGPRSRGKRKWHPYNRGENSRSPNPASIVAASFNAAEDRAALVGTGCDDVPGAMVDVPGGPSGRGPTDGRMVYVERIVRDFVVRDAAGELQEIVEIETGWKMERGRGGAELLPPCRVNRGAPAPLARFVRQAGPTAARPCRDENRLTDRQASTPAGGAETANGAVRLRPAFHAGRIMPADMIGRG